MAFEFEYYNAIAHDRKTLTFGEWVLSLFSENYRKHAVDREVMVSNKDKTKKICVPYHCLYNPWTRKWYRIGNLLELQLTVQASLKIAEQNVKDLKASAKKADVYCTDMVNGFAKHLVKVYGSEGVGGVISYHDAGEAIALSDLSPSKKAGRTIIAKPKAEPRSTNNSNKGKQNNQHN